MNSQRYRQLQVRRGELVAEARRLMDHASPSDADTARANEILRPARAAADGQPADAGGELARIDAELATFAALFEAERRAPATAAAAAGPHVSVRDRSEDDPMRGFGSLGEFALAVHRASAPGARSVDQRLRALYEPGTSPGAAPTDYHQEGHSAEGYMVPPAAAQKIWELVFSGDDLLGMIGAEPIEGNSVPWVRDESTPWGGTGVQAYWRKEAAQMTPSKLATEPSQLRVHELYAFVTATGEVLADTALLQSRLSRKAPEAIRYKASNALARGTGVGQPLGFLNAPCLITVAKESSQSAAGIIAKNLTKMYSRKLNMPGSRWVWLANGDVVPELIDLKLGNEPSWVGQNQGLQNEPSGRILGHPIFFMEHFSTMGTVGDINLVDLAGYYAIVRQGLQFASSIHLYFDYNVEAFRWIFRVGGEPYLSAAVSPDNGTTTKSAFITLATRP